MLLCQHVHAAVSYRDPAQVADTSPGTSSEAKKIKQANWISMNARVASSKEKKYGPMHDNPMSQRSGKFLEYVPCKYFLQGILHHPPMPFQCVCRVCPSEALAHPPKPFPGPVFRHTALFMSGGAPDSVTPY